MTTYTASSGSPVNDQTLSNGDALVVDAGGRADANTLLAGAFEPVSSDGSATSTTVGLSASAVIGGLETARTFLGPAHQDGQAVDR